MIELAVVIPTLNEAANVAELVARLDRTLAGIEWEAIFVDDDSVDGTRDVLARLAAADPRIRVLHRIGRRGLSSACIEGMLATTAPILAVMDADLQHDETLLPRMLHLIRGDEADIVVASRYVAGGSTGQWDQRRLAISRLATRVSLALIRVPVSDPMSGFFMLTRDLLNRSLRQLSGKGFKILLDILASTKGPVRLQEVALVFGVRRAGESKLDTLVAYEFALLLYDKLIGHLIPARFLMFVSVGALGALLHLGVLGMATQWFQAPFSAGQSLATGAAMVMNFVLNNVFTHRDRRLRGAALAMGLTQFMLLCSVGAVASVGVGQFLFEHSIPWWVSGLLGGLVGAVWNYSSSALFVWHRKASG
jgi:dolichol-phosphate mannosyltransferase